MAPFAFALLTLALGASTAFAGSNHAIRHEQHDKLVRAHPSGSLTARTNANEQDWKLHKRFDDARFTNFEAGQGACGGAPNTDSDSIVALNADQYGGGEHCFEMITISYNGKSKQAQITDKCPGCPFGGLDLTPSLFEFLAPLGDGQIQGSWSFGGGGGGGSSSSSSSSSSTWSPTSTQHSKTSSTWSPTSTSWSSTSTLSSTSASTSSSTSSSSTSSSSTAVPSATSGVDLNSLIDLLGYGVVQLGGLVAGAAQVNLQITDSS